MAEEQLSPVLIEDAELIYRNFSGREGPYNLPGSRNFCVVLDPVIADQLVADGWNVRLTKVQEEGDDGRPYLPVQIGYKIRPPRVVLITSRGRTTLDESMIEILDWVDIRTADLIANPSHWDVGGKSGIKAYLKTLFVTIEEDYLEQKYGITASDMTGEDAIPLDEQ